MEDGEEEEEGKGGRGKRYYKYRGYSDFGVRAAAAKGTCYVACLGDFSRTPRVSLSLSLWKMSLPLGASRENVGNTLM